METVASKRIDNVSPYPVCAVLVVVVVVVHPLGPWHAARLATVKVDKANISCVIHLYKTSISPVLQVSEHVMCRPIYMVWNCLYIVSCELSHYAL